MLNVQKKERLVLDERSSQLPAKISPAVCQIPPARLPGKSDALIAKQSKGPAMQSSAARPGGHFHGARGSRARRNIHHRPAYRQLLHRTQRNILRGPTLRLIVQLDAIQPVQRSQPALLMNGDRKISRLRRIQRSSILHDDSRLELRRIQSVPAIDRQFVNLLRTDLAL